VQFEHAQPACGTPPSWAVPRRVKVGDGGDIRSVEGSRG